MCKIYDKNETMSERNVSRAMKKRVAAEQKWRCAMCLELLDMTYEIDHKIPLWKYGSNFRYNLQVSIMQI